jgi:hypothetical protein
LKGVGEVDVCWMFQNGNKSIGIIATVHYGNMEQDVESPEIMRFKEQTVQ